jgi:hypothetical protein
MNVPTAQASSSRRGRAGSLEEQLPADVQPLAISVLSKELLRRPAAF